MMVWGSLGGQIVFNTVSNSVINNIHVTGCKTTVGAPVVNCIIFTGCSMVSGNNITVTDSTNLGVSIVDSTDMQFSNVKSQDNTNYGWYESGSTDRCIKSNVNLKGNVAGGILQIGANSAISSWVNTAGVFRDINIGVYVE
jgi:hypothetical protein